MRKERNWRICCLLLILAPGLAFPQAVAGAGPVGPNCWISLVSPPSQVGTDVSIHASGGCDGGIRAMRFLVDGGVIYEFGGPDATAIWHAGGNTGTHSITIQAAAPDDPNWVHPAGQTFNFILAGTNQQSYQSPSPSNQPPANTYQSPQPTQPVTPPTLPPIPSPAPHFVLGFKALHDLDPADVGDALDNQSSGSGGDAIQHTTKGLMVWRKADNWTAFTNGYRTWINGPSGLQTRLNSERFPWEGDAGLSGTTFDNATITRASKVLTGINMLVSNTCSLIPCGVLGDIFNLKDDLNTLWDEKRWLNNEITTQDWIYEIGDQYHVPRPVTDEMLSVGKISPGTYFINTPCPDC